MAADDAGSGAMSVVLDEARDDDAARRTHLRLACRLLPRGLRDDVYLLYLVFRTLDDLVDERRPGARTRVAAVERLGRGGAGPRTREARMLDRARAPARPPAPCAAPSSAPACAQDLAGEPLSTEADVDRYCYRVAGNGRRS